MDLPSNAAAIAVAPPGASSPALRIDYWAADSVKEALARIGRTEDIDFSPSGKRLALAGFHNDCLLILDVEAEGRSVAVSNCLEVTSPAFKSPHGLCWLDERMLIVGNRYGAVSIFKVPEECSVGRIALDPVRTIGADPAELIDTPGSVVGAPIGLGLIELTVCNNFVHYLSRHLLDARESYAPVASTVVAANGLTIPDGIARSRSGRWLATSNHEGQTVLIFADNGCIDPFRQPAAVLRGIVHPHGLAFTLDERALLVADAGARFVRLFVSEDGRWAGEYEPQASIKVMDEALFDAGDFVLCDRGPKGIALSPDGRLLATTCEKQTLAFFNLRGVITPSVEIAAAPDAAADAELARAALLAHLVAARLDIDEATRAIRAAGDSTLEAMSNSRSWRLTAPLRRLRAAMRRS